MAIRPTGELLISVCVALVSAAAVAAHPKDCEVSIPQHVVQLKGAATSYGSETVAAVCQGSSASFFGDDSTIFLGSGAAATIAGSDNRVYAADGSAMTLTGSDNIVFSSAGARVEDISGENRLHTCESLHLDRHHVDDSRCQFPGWIEAASSGLRGAAHGVDRAVHGIETAEESIEAAESELTSATEGLEIAAGILGNIADLQRRLVEDLYPDAVPHPSNSLIGTWRVASARINDTLFLTSGKIILYRDGRGAQNYIVDLSGTLIPQVGTFQWRSDRERVYVDEEVVWRRRLDRPHLQEVELALEDHQRIVLRLERP